MGQQFLFKSEEVVNLKNRVKCYNFDYKVNLKNLVEEQRLILGMGETYDSLFDEVTIERL